MDSDKKSGRGLAKSPRLSSQRGVGGLEALNVHVDQNLKENIYVSVISESRYFISLCNG